MEALYLKTSSAATLAITQLLVRPTSDGCTSPLFAVESPVTLQIRDVRLELPPECSNASLATLLPNVASPLMLPRCSDATYLEATGTKLSMCSRAATCTDEPIANITDAPTSPSCSCTHASYAAGDLNAVDTRLAPYQPDGCFTPVVATVFSHIVTAPQVLAVPLAKNATVAASRTLDLTLDYLGTDWLNGSDYTWTVTDPHPTRWLQVILTSGIVNASVGSDRADSTIPIVVSSDSVRDGTPETAIVSVLFTPLSSVRARSPPPQLLNFTVKAYVSAEAVRETSSFASSTAEASIGVEAAWSFVARDLHRLQLQHAEVTRFSANLTHEATGEAVLTTLAYAYNGTYSVSAIPQRLDTHVLRMTLEDEAGIPHPVPSTMRVEVGCREPEVPTADRSGCGCGPGTAADGSGGCRACEPGSYQQSVTTGLCHPCEGDHVTSEPGANSIERCVCATSYFNDTSAGNGAWCVLCADILGASCQGGNDATLSGVTLADLNLSIGHWRLSNLTKDVRACAGTPTASACIGGLGSSYCATGYQGPLCATCAGAWHYFKDGRCLACENHGVAANALPLCSLVIGVCAAALLVRSMWPSLARRNRRARSLTAVMTRSLATASRLGVLPKLKLLLGYYQVVLAVPLVYDVQLPQEYIDAMRVFEIIRFDWDGGLSPAACVGDFGTRLALVATMPLVLLALVVVLGLVATAHKWRGRIRNGSASAEAPSRPVPLEVAKDNVASLENVLLEVPRVAPSEVVIEGLLFALPTTLFCCFLLVPSVARRIFSSFSCDAFGYDDRAGTEHYYLHTDYSIRCSYGSYRSEVQERIKLLALLFIIIWPIGVATSGIQTHRAFYAFMLL